MIDTEKKIARLIEAYKAAVLAKDAQALMELYDPGARVFDAWMVFSYESSAAWQKALESWLNSLENERVDVTFEDVRTIEGGDLTMVTAIVTYAAITTDGQPGHSMQNRITWGLRTAGDEPRIVHEHTSAPFGADSKAILEREEPS